MRQLISLLIFLCVSLLAGHTDGQTKADPELLSEISKIKAIDNHAHPLKYVAEGEKPDDEFDALPLDAVEPFPLPVRLKLDNPEFIGAWRTIYGYTHNDMSEAHVRKLLETKQRIMRERGDGYPEWILDLLNIETMFANRVAMGRGLNAPRFRWVAFDDALMFPLNNEAAKRSNPDYHSFFPGEERLLKRYLGDLKVAALPPSLDQYLNTIVAPTLARQKKNGTVAIKFEAAYLRKLDFDNPDQPRARLVYARYARGGEPPADGYKALQDFLFYYIARAAGRLGMAVHIHCIS